MDKFNQVKLFVYEKKKKIIAAGCLVLIFLIATFVFLQRDKFQTEKITYENMVEEVESPLNEESEVVEDPIYYFIDIKGYVNNPGVYSLEKGKRVVDAINKAGGLKKDANTSLLNLSMELTDEMVIVVYSNSEITNLEKTKEKEEQTEVICKQEIKNDACICNTDTVVNGTGETSSNTNDENNNSDLENENDTSKEETKTLVNINSASLQELMTLSNIGESKAQAIIDYREKNGDFKTIEEIKNVSGIGDKLFESIKENITV